MSVCKKMITIILANKNPTKQERTQVYVKKKNVRISCSRNDCKYTWEKTARTSCHKFETNGRPYSWTVSKNIMIQLPKSILIKDNIITTISFLRTFLKPVVNNLVSKDSPVYLPPRFFLNIKNKYFQKKKRILRSP